MFVAEAGLPAKKERKKRVEYEVVIVSERMMTAYSLCLIRPM